MEEREDELHFGYTEISWEIENGFCIGFKKTWEVCSPEFSISGFNWIKWQLILKSYEAEGGEYVASIHLKKLESAGFPGNARVCWKLFYSYGEGYETLSEKESILDSGVRFMAGIQHFHLLQEKLKQISSDKLSLKILLLVSKTEHNAVFVSHDPRLKAFSQDFYTIFNSHLYSDLTLRFNGKYILCHKHILSVRSKFFEDYINNMRVGEDSITLDWSCEDSLKKLLKYLYTGNLSYILRSPSISMERAINYFGISELESYYMKDYLTLKTKYEGNEFYTKWVVLDSGLRNGNSISSPPFSESGLDTVFKLRLELVQAHDHIESMSIFLDIIDGSKPRELHITFEILDRLEHSAVQKNMSWSSEEGGHLGIENFVSRDIIDDPNVFYNGAFCIICSLFIPTGSTPSFVVKRKSCLRTNFNKEEHYAQLSRQIESLFDTSKFNDLIIRCQNEAFKAHGCILSVRSPKFKEIIEDLSETSGGMSIANTDPRIARLIFRYIYSGILRYDTNDLIRMYNAAEEFGLNGLTREFSEKLGENLSPLCVIPVYILACRSKNVQLKNSTLQFIINNIKEIRLQDDWRNLVSDKALYADIKKYAEKHSKDNPNENFDLADFDA